MNTLIRWIYTGSAVPTFDDIKDEVDSTPAYLRPNAKMIEAFCQNCKDDGIMEIVPIF
jgi:hypothetical protein